jgi:hypothetical protein
MYILAMVVYMENVIRRYDGLDKTVIITKPYILCQIGKISNHLSQTIYPIYAHIAHTIDMMVCQVSSVFRRKMRRKMRGNIKRYQLSLLAIYPYTHIHWIHGLTI